MIGVNGRLFSPLEQDVLSPDTLEHSTDEGKSSLNGSSATLMLLSQCCDHIKPQQSEGQIQNIQSLEIEPTREQDEMGETSYENTDASITKGVDPTETSFAPTIFREFVDTKMTVSQLKQKVPGITLEALISKCEAITGPEESWILKCLIHAFLFDPNINIRDVFQEETQQKYILRGLPENLNRIVSDCDATIWSNQEIEIIHAFSAYDLTAESMHESLPNRKIDEIIEVLTYDFEVITWTTPETKVLEARDYIASSNLVQYIPYRTEEQISTIRRKIAECGTNAYLDINDKFHKPLLLKCLGNDLTRAVLEDSFPFFTTEEITKKLRDYSLTSDLTAGEKRSLKDYIRNDVPMEIVLYNFPCRSRELVADKYREAEYVSSRKSNFKNYEERLVYEAKWVVLANGDIQTGRRSRKRSSLNQKIEILERETRQLSKKKIKIEITPEQKAERARRALEVKKKAQEKLEQKKTLLEIKKAELERRRSQGLVKSSSNRTTLVKDLQASSEHFQSVVGDKQKVEHGQKRKRVQTEYYLSLLEEKKLSLKTRPRQVHKNEIKKALKMKEKKEQIKKQISRSKKTGKKRKFGIKKERDAEDEYDERFATPTYIKEEIEKQIEEEKDDYVSPFDPTDINSDTLVPLNGRELFEPGFYGPINKIKTLNYVEQQGQEELSKDLMTCIDDKILLDDDFAVYIIKNHRKNYKSLPISFPSLGEGHSEDEGTKIGLIKSRNIVRVRFLIHPQHCELFVLAAPKSNELDPIYEIVKLFMIHYTLYFAHSSTLKAIITEDYCEALEKSVEENDFSEFMFVIDKWNSLMLHISPNEQEVKLVKASKREDLNTEVRDFLAPEEIKIPSIDDLKVNTFYEEIMLEDLSPSFQIVKLKIVKAEMEPGKKTNRILKSIINTIGVSDGVEIPHSVSNTFNDLKPKDYSLAFFARLQEKTTISRFTMQQILLRVYSRIVSTDSRKLRSYKAFTAEVYGELLPSFTSEVLEKVNLLPYQKFYDLGSGVGNTAFQAALEFGAMVSGGCELMDHASKLTRLQQGLLLKHLAVLGLKQPVLDFALLQSFVGNDVVRKSVLECDVLIINNYLFDVNLNSDVGRLLYGLRPGTKIISLRNFIRPRYRATGDTIFDRLKVEVHEMTDFLSVSWTASKVPYYISTVQDHILPEYLSKDESPDYRTSTSSTPPIKFESDSDGGSPLTPVHYDN